MSLYDRTTKQVERLIQRLWSAQLDEHIVHVLGSLVNKKGDYESGRDDRKEMGQTGACPEE